jgi:hypothetical protein
VLERRIFVVALIGIGQRLVQRSFKALGESRHKSSLFLHHALQRMLVLTGKVHDLSHFGLGDFECIDPAFTNAVIVNVEHDACRIVPVLLKEPLQNVDDEFHRRVIVIENQHAIEAGLFRLCLGTRYDSRAAPGIVPPVVSRLQSGSASSHGIPADGQSFLPSPRRSCSDALHVGIATMIVRPSFALTIWRRRIARQNPAIVTILLTWAAGATARDSGIGRPGGNHAKENPAASYATGPHAANMNAALEIAVGSAYFARAKAVSKGL